jgi:hypothetical protein
MFLRPQVRSHCCYFERILITSREHFFKHIKPFKCSVPDCKHMEQGFASAIDLLDHKRSIHQKGTYRCASEFCRNNLKIWPTHDNYRQHLKRMHMGEDHVQLIRKYDEKTHILEALQLTMHRSYIPPRDKVAPSIVAGQSLPTQILDVDVDMVDV